RNVPLSSFADIKYEDTYGVIKRKNQKRLVTVSSNVTDESKKFETVAEVQKTLANFLPPAGVTIHMTGEQEEQAEDQAFLNWALMASILLIILILVIQFNSFSKPLIILTEIIFSLIGFCICFSLFNMEIFSIMCMVGVIDLAGIVVRNGILLV